MFTTPATVNVAAVEAASAQPVPSVTVKVPLVVEPVVDPVQLMNAVPSAIVGEAGTVIPVGNVAVIVFPAARLPVLDDVKPKVQVDVAPAAVDAGEKVTLAGVLAPATVANPRRTIAIATTLTANLFTRSIGLKPGELPDPTFE